MKDFSRKMKELAPCVLRYAMAAVILWFGLQQFINTNYWTAYVPDYIVKMSGLSAVTLVYFNAVFEIVFGFLLAIGYGVRIVAFLLALHLLDIMWTVGYGEIGVRDFGLAIATLVVAMNGHDMFSFGFKNEDFTQQSQSSSNQAPKVRINS